MADTDNLTTQQIIALTAWGEARGEPYLGQVAIICVIMNRAKHGGWWGSNPRDVCLKYEQFDCWMENDPNRAKILAIDPTDDTYTLCMEVAATALAGCLTDVTGGADSYCRTGLVKDWNKNLTPCAVIGHQSFYKTI